MSKPRPSPLSIRLSDEERKSLVARAGGRPLGSYIKEMVLGGQFRSARRPAPVRDAAPLGQILGLLGRSHLSSNLNQITKAANLGALPVTAEVEADLRQACADVFAMRRLLMVALGLKVPGEDWSGAKLSDLFGLHGRPE